MTDELSEYATSVPRGLLRVRVADHPEQRAAAAARRRSTQSALNILWRQCSEFACANIISSTSVGLRPMRVKFSTRYSISSSDSASPISRFARSSAARPPPSSVDGRERLRLVGSEEALDVLERGRARPPSSDRERAAAARPADRRTVGPALRLEPIRYAALDALDRRQSPQ